MTTTEKWPLARDVYAEKALDYLIDEIDTACGETPDQASELWFAEIADTFRALRTRLAEAETRKANLLEVLEEARADLEYVTEHQGYENTEAMALTLSRVIAALEGGDNGEAT